MKSKTTRARRKPPVGADDVEKLYLKLLHWFYEKEDRKRAQKVAKLLEAALTNQPEVAGSIRGEEIRSLLAELRGDLTEAIRSRESEIRKILVLHNLARDKPGWEYVRRQYDDSDISDRFDLLAALYAEHGDLNRAVDTLHESKQYCKARNIAFDGQAMLDEFEKARRNNGKTSQ